MKRGATTILLLLVMLAGAFGQTSEVGTRYPNELAQFRFFQNAKWNRLTPSVSSIADMRALLGEPLFSTDLMANDLFAPYPGDSKVTSANFSYSNLMPGWGVLLYFGKDCGDVRIPRLCGVALFPEKPLSFASVKFPSVFKKKHVISGSDSWDEYRDGSGLLYEVYTSTVRTGEHPGDLKRIWYGRK